MNQILLLCQCQCLDFNHYIIGMQENCFQKIYLSYFELKGQYVCNFSQMFQKRNSMCVCVRERENKKEKMRQKDW